MTAMAHKQYAHVVLKEGVTSELFVGELHAEFCRILADVRRVPVGTPAFRWECVLEVPPDDCFLDFDVEVESDDGDDSGIGYALYEAFEEPFVRLCRSFIGPVSGPGDRYPYA